MKGIGNISQLAQSGNFQPTGCEREKEPNLISRSGKGEPNNYEIYGLKVINYKQFNC